MSHVKSRNGQNTNFIWKNMPVGLCVYAVGAVARTRWSCYGRSHANM